MPRASSGLKRFWRSTRITLKSLPKVSWFGSSRCMGKRACLIMPTSCSTKCLSYLAAELSSPLMPFWGLVLVPGSSVRLMGFLGRYPASCPLSRILCRIIH
uniref:Uncharacterized protein n=1 Tax=Opuntia streptacantha TaxID=393608 RepID=A0A7C9CG84_OPUST